MTAVNIKYVSVPSKRLATSITGSATTIALNDILGWDGVALTSADLGDRLWAVLRNDDNTLMEIMELDPTTIASATITILARGLKFNGDTVTQVSANKLTWVKNETIVDIGTHPPQLLAQAVNLSGNQTIADVKTFSSSPIAPDPTTAQQVATKNFVEVPLVARDMNSQKITNLATGTAAGDGVNVGQLNAAVIGGGVDANATTKGIVKLSSNPGLVLGNPTITIANPAVVTLNSHGLIAGDEVKFTTTGALPTGIVSGTTYFVVATVSTNVFSIATTAGGTAITTTGSQSGTHTLTRLTPFAVNSEEVSTTSTANSIPRANASGKLDVNWLTLPSCNIVIPQSVVGAIALASQGLSTTTRMPIGLVSIPQTIAGTKVTFKVEAYTSTGTAKVVLYTYDGQTQVFLATTATISGTGFITTTISSTITAGQYWVGIVATGTSNFSIDTWATDAGTTQFSNAVAGKPILEGYYTVTAGTPPATITPSSITYSQSFCPVIRLDA